jgi:hypothetical protein
MKTKKEIYFEYLLLIKEHYILINKLNNQINYLDNNLKTFDMLFSLYKEVNAKNIMI